MMNLRKLSELDSISKQRLKKAIRPLLIAGLLFLVIASSLVVPFARAQTVIATVQVGTGPFAVAYDSAKGEVFVANFYSNTVSVISDGTNTVVATIPVGTNPAGVAYDFLKSQVFVSNDFSNDVSVISDSTNTVVATVSIGAGSGPLGAAYDFAKGEVFVTDIDSN